MTWVSFYVFHYKSLARILNYLPCFLSIGHYGFVIA